MRVISVVEKELCTSPELGVVVTIVAEQSFAIHQNQNQARPET